MKRKKPLAFIASLAFFLFLVSSGNVFADYNMTALNLYGSDNATVLPVGNVLQLIDAGPNGSIDSIGGGDDSIIKNSTVGVVTDVEGTAYLVITGNSVAQKVFLRAFNTTNLATATKYGESDIINTIAITSPPTVPDYYSSRISTTKDIPPGSITGSVTYTTGNGTGNIKIGLFDNANPGSTTATQSVTISTPGSFNFTDVPVGTWYIGAFMDIDGGNEDLPEVGDPAGMLGPLTVASGAQTNAELALTNTPATMIFTNDPLSITAGTTNNLLTITLYDIDNTITTTDGPININLTSTSLTGKFLDTSGNALTSPPQVTIDNGASYVSFKYSDTKADTPIITGIDAKTVLTDKLPNVTQQQTVTAATADPASSTVERGSNNISTDGDTSTITVVLKDQYGNPVTNTTVKLSADGTLNAFTNNETVTDTSGSVAILISSILAHTETITAKVGTIDVGTVNVTFIAGAVSATNSTVSSGGTTHVSTDGGATATITVTLKDANNNLIAGKDVTLESTNTVDNIIQPTAQTDANGQTTGTIASTKAEAKTVTAKIGNTTITETAGITFDPGVAKKFKVTSLKDKIASDEKGSTTVSATITDINGNKVTTDTGTTVNFSVTNGGDYLAVTTAAPTTFKGVAETIVTSKVGNVPTSPTSTTVTATSTGLTGNPSAVAINIVNFSATPDATNLVTGQKAITISAVGATNSNYTWSKTGPGTLSSTTGTSITFTAPTSINETTTGSGEKTTITVKDADDNNISFTLDITTFKPVTITNSADGSTVLPGETPKAFTVTGGDSTNNNYTWSVTGPVTVEGGTGNSYSFTAPAPKTGNFAGEYTITVTDPKGFSDSFKVMVPISVTPKAITVIATEDIKFFVTGTAGTLNLELLSTATSTSEVAAPDDYGTFSSEVETLFTTANATEITTFYLRLTVTGDSNLTGENGLNTQVVGPFTIIPTKPYTVTLSDNDGPIDGRNGEPGENLLVSVRTMGKLLTGTPDGSGEITFNLPATGSRYRYEITDNATNPTYFDITASEDLPNVEVTLVKIGTTNTINIFVQDTKGNPLHGAIVKAFQPTELAKRNPIIYTAKEVTIIGELSSPTSITRSPSSYTLADIASNYTISLPDKTSTNGWTIIASLEGYESRRLEEQTNDVIFAGTENGLPEKTVLTVKASKVPEQVKLDITATPPFTADEYLNQFEISLKDGNATQLETSPYTFVSANATISLNYKKIEDFSVLIKADTSDDNNTGTFDTQTPLATQIFNYFRGQTTGDNSTEQKAMGFDGGKSIITFTDTDTGKEQKAEVFLPTGGITKNATITIRRMDKTDDTKPSTKGSSLYVYQVSATDDNGTSLTSHEDGINRIEITLPFDTTVIHPGDFKNKNYVIYHASNLELLETGGNNLIPVKYEDIINIDFIGTDGITGYVTFWVNHLSVFGIGLPFTSSSTTSTSSDSRCFIATAAFGSPFEAHVSLLRKFRDIYLLPTHIGSSFVNTYYRLSPPMADFIAQHDTLRAMVRVLLVPAIAMSYVMVNFGIIATMLVFGGLFALACFLLYRLGFARKEAVVCR